MSTLTIDEAALAREEGRLAEAFGALGDAVKRVAQQEAPVLTGQLRDSIYVLVFHRGARVYGDGPRPDGITGQGVEVFIGTDTARYGEQGYARWVHDGTSDTSPHPFMATAMAQIGPRAAGIIAAAF